MCLWVNIGVLLPTWPDGEVSNRSVLFMSLVGLVLGNRADLTSLKDKEQKCIIEAFFELSLSDPGELSSKKVTMAP